MVQAKVTTARPRSRRRWMKFTESQLVLANCGTKRKKRTMTERQEIFTEEPATTAALITPSPSHARQNNKKTQNQRQSLEKKTAQKQLFTTVTTTKHVIQEEENEGAHARRRLFVKNTTSSTGSGTSSKSSTIQSRRVSSTCWDSLALMSSSLETTVRLKRTVRKRGRRKKMKKKLTSRKKLLPARTSSARKKNKSMMTSRALLPSEQDTGGSTKPSLQQQQQQQKQEQPQQRSWIPPELVCVLAPLGLSKAPRTSEQVLADHDNQMLELRQGGSTRTKFPRACKDMKNGRNYSEESGDDADDFGGAIIDDGDEEERSNEFSNPSLVSQRGNSPPKLSESASVLAETPACSVGKLPLPQKEEGLSVTRNNPRKTADPIKTTKTIVKHKFGRPRRRKQRFTTTKIAKDSPRVDRFSPWNAKQTLQTQQCEENENINRAASVIRKPVNPDRSIKRSIETRAVANEEPAPQRRRPSITSRAAASTHSKANSNQELPSPIQPQQPIVQVISGSPKRKKNKKKKAKKKKSKVRFAPLPETTTTTFSVKIRVKTSANPSLYQQGTIAPPCLDKSTIQSITNQIATACMTAQARNNHSNYASIMGEARPKNNNLIASGPPRQEEEREKPLEVQVDCDSSVISDLTRERDRHRAPPLDRIEEQVEVVDFGEPNNGDNFTGERGGSLQARGGEMYAKERLRRRTSYQSSPNRASSKLPLSGAKLDDKEDASFASLNRRRKRGFHSSDSLAGVSLASATDNASITTPKLPVEVSVKSPNQHSSCSASMQRKRAREICPDETVVTEYSVLHSQDSCTCSGCQRKFDCLNCDNCVVRLETGEYNSGKTDCMRRVCQVIRRHAKMDSLGMAARKRQQAATQNACEDDDDFTYLSEVAWGNNDSNQKSNRNAKRLSRTARLWGSSAGSVGMQIKRSQNVRGAESISSETTMTGNGTSPPPVAPPTARQVSKSRSKRTKGRKKDPLHYMELPMPADGSVASWMEGRKHMRALMHYDEADQDWV